MKIMEKTQSFTPWPLIFKLQQQVLRFKICVSWSSPKTGLETNFFIEIPLLNKLFFSFDNLFRSLIELKRTCIKKHG